MLQNVVLQLQKVLNTKQLWTIVFVPCFESLGQLLALRRHMLNKLKRVQDFLRTLGALFDVCHDLRLLSKALSLLICFAGTGRG